MVSQDSPPNPSSSIFHQFIVSDSMTAGQTHLESHNLDAAYESSFRSSTTFSQSLGLLPNIQSLGERMSRSIDLLQTPREESDMSSHTRHLMDLPRVASMDSQAQRLSLSLGSHMLVPSVHNHFLIGEESREAQHVTDEYCFIGSGIQSSTTPVHTSLAVVVGNSRYLKPAQSLLEEIVNVGAKSVDISNEKHVGKLYGEGRRGVMGISSELKADLCCNGMVSADKNELQARLANLITLLEQVEDRCEKYYHQMEEVMSSFEMVVGEGAAKCYTALALKAMSRHFCSLKAAIVSHIYTEKRKLLQDSKIGAGISQLGLFDREFRHKNMSLQQIGIFQSQHRQNWRPIRGLPETSVTILRSWLFEHFLHPYPNDSEKLVLATQTGLSKNQVSNWFINARVRLWKPMIEEMYKEEFGESSEDSNSLAAGSMNGEGYTDQSQTQD